MSKTTIDQLGELDQSVWLDSISRSLIESGRLKEMIGMGLTGMTSNPTIFDKAISSSNDYDEQLRWLYRQGLSTFEIYDDLTIKDIQDAADKFKSIYEETKGLDGFVSLEINPKLAYKKRETIAEGKRLAKRVNRPNVMFKVPATDAGYEAIEELLAEGTNVNVTLIFSLEQYKRTAGAYVKGMKRFLQKQGNGHGVCSVASVFVSRIDTAVDTLLDELIEREQNESKRNEITSLKGKAAIANSNLIYREYVRVFSGEEFRALQEHGVNVQRLLWGSTGTKNPAYSDIKYVTELIGKNTINTVPEKTFEAFLDHGYVKETLTSDVQEAQTTINSLQRYGIDIHNVCETLLQDGVIAFEKSFESLLDSIEKKIKGT